MFLVNPTQWQYYMLCFPYMYQSVPYLYSYYSCLLCVRLATHCTVCISQIWKKRVKSSGRSHSTAHRHLLLLYVLLEDAIFSTLIHYYYPTPKVRNSRKTVPFFGFLQYSLGPRLEVLSVYSFPVFFFLLPWWCVY